MSQQPAPKPWYKQENQDALIYLLIAIFFVELVVGGVAFFYGIIHAAPDMAGGPPVARFPWLAWSLAAVLAPVALLLIIHLAGSFINHTLSREDTARSSQSSPGNEDKLPESMSRFFTLVRHAPTVLVLGSILLLGAALFFIDGAFGRVLAFMEGLLPWLPWLASSAAALLGFCFLVHCLMVYRQRKMEQEYAWRREVLEKTGVIISDKNSLPLTAHTGETPSLMENGPKALPGGQTLEVEAKKSEENPEK